MFAAIAAFFVFGTFGFWLSFVLLGMVIFWNIENEEVGIATLSTLILATVVLWANDLSLWGLIKTNPIETLLAIGGYFVAGTLWSIGKWYFYIRRYNHEYEEIKRDYLHQLGLTSVDQFVASQKQVFRAKVIESFNRLSGRYRSDTFKFPLAAERKTAILGWMMYWPFSMTWTLINDPVKRAFITIYRNIAGGLDRMTVALTGNISREVDLGEVKEK